MLRAHCESIHLQLPIPPHTSAYLPTPPQVLRAHCESINLQFGRRVTLKEVYDVLEKVGDVGEI